MSKHQGNQRSHLGLAAFSSYTWGKR